MKQYTKATIAANTKINKIMYQMTLYAPEITNDAQCGQFINIYLGRGDLILPRPISICHTDCNKGELTILYQIMGKGTDYMSTWEAGKTINIAGPMGNGFSYKMQQNVALIGGGIGVPPLYSLALHIKQKNPDANIHGYFGFKHKDIVILEQPFETLGVETHIATDDGSYGFHGNALNCFINHGQTPDILYACGPSIMLKFVSAHAQQSNIPAQVSLEERMGCGLGGCVGCAVAIKNNSPEGFEYKKVCKDGPVFDIKEVLWQ